MTRNKHTMLCKLKVNIHQYRKKSGINDDSVLFCENREELPKQLLCILNCFLNLMVYVTK